MRRNYMVSIIITIAVSGLLLLGTYEFTKKILLQKKNDIQKDWFGVELNDPRSEVKKEIRKILGGF